MADFTGIAQTDNLKLYKPGYSNVADIEVLNANADALDAAYKAYKDTAVDFIGASSSKPGVRGYVPAPAAGDQNKLLAGDGTWKTPFTESDIAKIAHPVGSVLAFADGTDPNTKWSGMTWVQFAQGRTLVGAGTYSENGTNYTYTNGDTGGEAKHKITLAESPGHTHTGTTSSAGAHNHTGVTGSAGGHNHTAYGTKIGLSGDGWSRHSGSQYSYGNSTTSWSGAHTHTFTTNSNGAHTHTMTTSSAGGNGYHENRQPYVVVTYWKRTA